MEVESFEDEGIAKLLNEWFVSIKVSQIMILLLISFTSFSSYPVSQLLCEIL